MTGRVTIDSPSGETGTGRPTGRGAPGGPVARGPGQPRVERTAHPSRLNAPVVFRRSIAWLVRLPARGLLASVRLYQGLVSPVLPALFGPACGCRFHPTCSRYAAEAIATHGAWRGAGLALWRLVRCTPLSAGGLDPVPPRRERRWTCTRVRAA